MKSTRGLLWAALSALCLFAGVWVAFAGLPFGGLSTRGPTTAPENPAAPAESRQPGAELVFAKTDLNLGRILQSANGEFAFENQGQHPVRIHGVKASCSCTLTDPDKQVYKPGEKGVVKVHVESRIDRLGPQVYTVDVDYEGAIRRSERLLLRVQFSPDVIAPKEVAIWDVAGKTGEAEFTIVDLRERPLEITDVATSSAMVKARVIERPVDYRGGWHFRIGISVVAGERPVGDYSETVRVHTSDPERKTIVVQAKVHRAHRIRILPETLMLRADPESKGGQIGKILIDDTVGEAVELGSVIPSDSCLRFQVEKQGSSVRVVTVRYEPRPAEARPKALSIRLVLKNPTPGERCVTVVPAP